MSDKLKEHILSQRQNFELYDLELDNSWKLLNDKLNQRKSRKQSSYRFILKIAASLLIFCGGALSTLLYMKHNTVEKNEVIWQETVQYYQQMIDQQLILIKSDKARENILYDFREMDGAFAELRDDFKDKAQTEEVLAAMIENYRLKLRILERIVDKLEKENEAVKNSI